tara:strand:+ start:1096 stop:1803 length:708 start_codon:yes stop_codon:yes gene_type:complete
MSPLIISHRGKIDLGSPENVLIGIQEAIELGVDMVEFDVRRTKDGVLVCHHDATIGNRRVSDLSFNDLRKLQSSICKLDDVINICKNKVGVNLEIKELGFEVEIVEKLTANFNYEEIFVTSFSPLVIRKTKSLDSKIIAGLLIGDAINLQVFFKIIKEAIFMTEFYYSKADFISPYYKIYEMGLMKKFENNRIPIQLWTVNDLVFLKDLINSDIQSIVTDVPEKHFQAHQNSKNV